MDILVLGGTSFSGSYLTEKALEAGHHVTLYNRGRSAPGRFTEVDRLTGDRDPRVQRDGDDGLDALRGRSFDAVVDMCGFVPRVVAASCERLADAGRYVFVSSISAYADMSKPGVHEGSPLAEPPAPEVEEVTGETYGGLKVACERVVQAAHGDRATIIRPGLIVGPRDPTDRFSWWPVRLAEAGEAIVPAPSDTLVQVIDARDLAAFMLRVVEQGIGGVFNLVDDPIPFGEVIAACDPTAERVWADGAWLEEKGVKPWMELPLWVGTDPDAAGFGAASNQAARDAGLVTRPIAETTADTLRWFGKARGGRAELRTGLSVEREAELVAAWRAR